MKTKKILLPALIAGLLGVVALAALSPLIKSSHDCEACRMLQLEKERVLLFDRLDDASIRALQELDGHWKLAEDSEFTYGHAWLRGDSLLISYAERKEAPALLGFQVYRADEQKIYCSETDAGLPYLLSKEDGVTRLHFEVPLESSDRGELILEREKL